MTVTQIRTRDVEFNRRKNRGFCRVELCCLLRGYRRHNYNVYQCILFVFWEWLVKWCSLAKLPCCYNENSSIHYCTECVKIICTRASKEWALIGDISQILLDGNYGRCPTCASFITIDSAGRVKKVKGVGQCRCCSQSRLILDKRRQLCDACFLGRRFPLQYEVIINKCFICMMFDDYSFCCSVNVAIDLPGVTSILLPEIFSTKDDYL